MSVFIGMPRFQKRNIGPNARLEIRTGEDGTRSWALFLVPARGEERRIELGELSLDEPESRMETWLARLNHEAVGLMLRALLSVNDRPTDYGLSRQAIDAVANYEMVASLLLLMPTGRRIGRAKVQLTEVQRQVATNALTSPLGRELVLGLLRNTGESVMVGLRLPRPVFLALQADAEGRGVSPGQLVGELVEERYKVS